MVSLGSYLLGAARLVAVAVSIGFAAYRLRARLLPDWQGAPARLVESIVGIALLIWLSELLGSLSLFYAGILVAASVLLALGLAFLPGGGGPGGAPPGGRFGDGGGVGAPCGDRTRRPGRARARVPLARAGDGGSDRSRGRPLGDHGEARAGPGDLQLRLALVPHAVL